jgi:hypothetical protein
MQCVLQGNPTAIDVKNYASETGNTATSLKFSMKLT